MSKFLHMGTLAFTGYLWKLQNVKLCGIPDTGWDVVLTDQENLNCWTFNQFHIFVNGINLTSSKFLIDCLENSHTHTGVMAWPGSAICVLPLLSP